ncbi:hypothetical protein NDU88_001059 [Pleurodeles waltl]|uniref:Uncharacterized protein n=1 Tax=Pleurodeles waltl TaxID=8319 RepID=A0AAV7MNV9_PLEWA|nr:hypothetical protein NDU88_001059 [Pleurodeles waltl]
MTSLVRRAESCNDGSAAQAAPQGVRSSENKKAGHLAPCSSCVRRWARLWDQPKVCKETATIAEHIERADPPYLQEFDIASSGRQGEKRN